MTDKKPYTDVVEEYLSHGHSNLLSKVVAYNYKRLGIEVPPLVYLNDIIPYKNDLTSSLKRMVIRMENPDTPRYNLSYSIKNLTRQLSSNKKIDTIPYDIYYNYINSTQNYLPEKFKEFVFLPDEVEKKKQEIKQYGDTSNKYFKTIVKEYPSMKINSGRLLNFFINEKDTSDIYIPSSGNCLLKCILKYMELVFLNVKINPNIHFNPEAVSLDEVMKYLNTPIIPKIVFITEDRTFKEVELDEYTTLDSFSPFRIVLISLSDLYYHCVLSKDFHNIPIMSYSLNKCFTKTPKLEVESYFLRKENIKSTHNTVIAYDIETYIVKNPERDKSVILYPFALSYSFVDLNNRHPDRPTYLPTCLPKIIEKTNLDDESSSNVFDLFIEAIYNDIYEGQKAYGPCGGVKQPITYQVYAHFGGRFDNLYVKSISNKEMKIVQCIQKGTNIKQLEIQYKELTLIFKDSFNFSLGSLKRLSKDLNLKNKKTKVDIVHKDLQWFINNKKIWKPYLENDVLCLSELLYTIEPFYNMLGLSITVSATLSGLSWKLLNKTCYGMKRLTVPKMPSLKDFYYKSCYGGRVIHWKKFFDREVYNDVLINIDGNSLYPSVMETSAFPISEPILIEDLNFVNINKYPHYIIDCKIKPSNTKYPLHPYKDETGTLIYKVEPFRGVYNDVDIREMLKDDYEIVEVYRGVYFEKSYRLYSDLVNSLYEKRKEYKKKGDYIEYMLKIILNNLYGYHLEKHNEMTFYNEIKHSLLTQIKKNDLPNGQTEYVYSSMYNYVDKPIHIGGYVLSYARKIMNEYIRLIGPENIWYGDTDSLFVLKSVIKNKNIKIDNELCGVKNDYGENTYITKAIFLDRKKYILKIENEKTKEFLGKIKYSGINFKKGYKISNIKLIKDEKKFNKVFNEVYKPLLSGYYITIPYEQFRRLIDGVQIDEKEFKYSIIENSKKSSWLKGESIPIGYKVDEEEYKLKSRKLEHKDNKNKISQIQYDEKHEGRRVVYNSVIPMIDKENKLRLSDEHDKVRTSYIYWKDEIYYREVIKSKNKIKHILYECNEYGPKYGIKIIKDEEEMKKLEYYEVIGVESKYTIMRKEDF
jgi:hypothetical protein